METTLREIVKHAPCDVGIARLMDKLGYKCCQDDWRDVYKQLSIEKKNADIDFKFILESNGIKDTIWGLCTQDEKTRMRISADIAMSVLHIFEKHYPDDKRPRECIEAIYDYCDDKISKRELRLKSVDAAAAASAAYAAHAAYAAADVRENQWNKIREILLKYIK